MENETLLGKHRSVIVSSKISAQNPLGLPPQNPFTRRHFPPKIAEIHRSVIMVLPVWGRPW
jgi:hypothetical protein